MSLRRGITLSFPKKNEVRCKHDLPINLYKYTYKALYQVNLCRIDKINSARAQVFYIKNIKILHLKSVSVYIYTHVYRAHEKNY